MRYLKVLLVIIPACCGLAVVGAAINYALRPIQASQPAPVATPRPAQPQATAIQLPTATQPATFTPVPPSPIPAATQVPTRPATIQVATATNLPQPTVNPTISAYTAQALVQTQAYSTALHSFYTLNQSASNDPQLMLDDEWKTNMVVALATMQISAERLASIESSAPELSKIRDYFSKIDAETKLMVTNYAHGIDKLDKDSINAAIRNLENINTYILEASKELQKISISATPFPTVAVMSRVVPVSVSIQSSPTTNTPWPTPTNTPTWTPRPTSTPWPTSTTEPTWTPRPTSTPWPTSTTGPTWTPRPSSTPRQTSPSVCCKVCTTGKACGDTCIARGKTCNVLPGCACNR